jgi:hypothetical protein
MAASRRMGRDKIGATSDSFPRRDGARVLPNHHPLKFRGRREHRMHQSHPRHRMQKKTPQVRRNIGTPCAMVYGLYAFSSECRAC